MIISVRQMETKDIKRVLEIEKESFSTPWSEEAFRTEIEDNILAVYVVAEVDDEVVGYGGFWRILDEAHITNIAVGTSMRGKGIGEAILMGMIDYCTKNEIPHMTLEVRKSNQTALGLYKKHGFSEAGIRPGYYTDNHEDAVIMWKENLLR
ncbi:MAG: ribosomal protein S18-alanine N-acetyltransferase [Gudongella sp.]|jgi:ribosomal-protein-alanine N-acetyltransferase|nr:ribosomal protein S18-alanine N-acetyltransferase [Gudongella sp.]